MINNPKNGWCNFQIGEFEAMPSYLTNVPIDLLDCFIDYFTKNQGVCWFDCEGEEFTFVLTPCSTFIIYEGEKTMLYSIGDTPRDLAIELIKDIELDKNWFLWDEEMYKNQATKIKDRIYKLKQFTQNYILN
jgi:hypothetical protein